MSLQLEQQQFSSDVLELLIYARALGLAFSFGEVFRTMEQQRIYLNKGLSKTVNSMHLKRLAIDINFFFSDFYLEDMFNSLSSSSTAKDFYKKLAKFWVSLSPKNRAGYDWGWDNCHFERFVP